MDITVFQRLHDSFCEASGTAARQLQADLEGVAAFSAEIRGVVVNFLHAPEVSAGNAHMLVDFGPLPDGLEADAMRVLMMTNFTMLGDEGACAFSINPACGNVALQTTFPLHSATGAHLLHSVSALVEMALQWRSNHFLEPVAHEPAEQGDAS